MSAGRWKALVAATLAVAVAVTLALVTAWRYADRTPDLTFTVDDRVSPHLTALAGIDGGPTRPVASVVDDEDEQTDFVANEPVGTTGDPDTLAELLDRWDGEVLDTLDPAEADLDLHPLHLVRIDPSRADPDRLSEDLRALRPAAAGEFRVSSGDGLGLLAAAARESAGGLVVSANWLGTLEGISDPSTVGRQRVRAQPGLS